MKKIYVLLLSGLIGGFSSYSSTPVANGAKTGNVQLSSGKVLSQKGSVKGTASVNARFAHDASSLRHQQPNNTQFVFSDNFDQASDTTSLQARGYLTYYRGGGPQAAFPTWFTGNPATFPAYDGATNSYVGANYQVVSGTNDIDSWLVLPALNVATTDMLTFFDRSPDGSTFPDSIKVMYSASGDSTPEGTGWVMLDDFQVGVTGWEQKSYPVPTASANGRFAIRYAVVNGGPNGANSNYIGIDELNVGQLLSDDVGMVPPFPSQYTIIPLSQLQPIDVGGMVTNLGANSETNVGFNANVYEFQNLVFVGSIFSAPSNGVSLAPAAITPLLSAGPVTLPDTGEYLFQYSTFMDNADLNSSNDTLATQVNVNDTTYARDDEAFTGMSQVLGIQGVSFTAAQLYDFPNAGIIKSVSLLYANGNFGDHIQADVYDMAAGLPGSVVATSGPYTLGSADTSTQFLVSLTLPLTTPFAVGAGAQFFVAITQLDTNNMGLGHTANITTTGTVFYTADGGGTWPAFGGAFVIRPNMDLSNGVIEANVSKGISIYPNPSSGMIYIRNNGQKDNMTVTVFNSLGQSVYTGVYSNLSNAVIDLSSKGAGVYSIQIKSEKEIITKSIVISNK